MKDIETTIFDTPSGGIKALCTAFMDVRGKSKRIAHAMVFVDRPTEISLSVPPSRTLEGLAQLNALLQRFETVVRDLVAAHGPKGE
jgi:hypothetical protein